MSNAPDVMETMFGEDLFHAPAQGHPAFDDVAKLVADRLVHISLERANSRNRVDN